MPIFQKLEINDWRLMRGDPSLRSAIEGVISAGKMLHEGFYTGFNDKLFMGHSNPEAYISQSEKLMAEAIRRANPVDLIIGKTINKDADHTKGKVWLENGIDGFANFAQGRPFCDVMLTQVENGHLIRSVVFNFLNGDLYYAVRGEGSYINGQQLITSDPKMSKSTVIAYAPLVEIPERNIPEDKILVDALWKGMERITKKYRQFQREEQAGGLELGYVADGRLGGYASSWTTRLNLGGVLNIQEANAIATNMDGGEWKPGNRGVVAGTPKIQQIMLREFQRYLPKKKAA